jgi:hypothetical protein
VNAKIQKAAIQMSANIHLTFPHRWRAEILSKRPLILPPRHFTYPREAEEVERGALEIFIHPDSEQPFLATCALGFRDASVPTGIWSTPQQETLCAVSGGYAYLIDTAAPERFTMLPCRPVLEVRVASAENLLLFVDHRSILAWGSNGLAWASEKLSDEGLTITSMEGNILRGTGWHLLTDTEIPFVLDLRTGLSSK